MLLLTDFQGKIIMTWELNKRQVFCVKKIILASGSPRRKELLEQLGIEFEIRVSDCDEHVAADSPEELVLKLSEAKSRSVAAETGPGYIVIGADTVVVYDGEILGKPADSQDAVKALKKLRGHTHSVYTGVTLTDTDTGASRSFYEKTDVTMFDVSDKDICHYVETGEPLDKAGSYGIQGRGAFLVSSISGDYYNVVGLPVARLWQELGK